MALSQFLGPFYFAFFEYVNALLSQVNLWIQLLLLIDKKTNAGVFNCLFRGNWDFFLCTHTSCLQLHHRVEGKRDAALLPVMLYTNLKCMQLNKLLLYYLKGYIYISPAIIYINLIWLNNFWVVLTPMRWNLQYY